MKFGIFVALFALALTANVQKKNEMNDIMECLADHLVPIREEIVQLIAALQEKDYLKIIEIIPQVIESAEALYNDCFKTSTENGIKEIAQCVLKYIMDHPEEKIGIVLEIYNAIVAKNWLKVIKLVSEAVAQGVDFVKTCIG